MPPQADERVHILGIRHHGPGSAALLRKALDVLKPACVLVEGPPEGDDLIQYVADPDLKPPVAMLLHAADEPSLASFMPFAEFSPEWQAMEWALKHERPVRFCDWPAAVSLALRKAAQENPENAPPQVRADALDLLASAAGYEDGETFWNGLIEQHGASGQEALSVFASIETAMTEARAHEDSNAPSPEEAKRNLQREVFMRSNIRAALKEFEANIAVITGAWHVSGLRQATKPADDRAIIKDLPRVKIEATWVPWTDSRLSAFSGYPAGVISPGWYRHLWSLYTRKKLPSAEEFASLWQSRTAFKLREEGYTAPTASAIEATRLALGLAAMRDLPMPGIAEMREASLAAMCDGNPVPLAMLERKLYIGERVGEIGERVPQNPLARDLATWQRKTRLKPQDLGLRSLILSISVEINAGARIGPRGLDEDTAAARISAMEAYDEALRLFGDDALTSSWRDELGKLLSDDQVTPSIAGLGLRRLHDVRAWETERVAAEFARQTGSRHPKESGAFLEGFLRGGSEVLLQDEPLLQLLDAWLCDLTETDFTDSLPLLRRSMSSFDTIARRRVLEKVQRGRQQSTGAASHVGTESNPAFEAALPLLYKILGLGEPA